MTLFITSSPYIDGADRAIFNPENEFVDRLRDSLPRNPSALFICSTPWDHDTTCRWGADTISAFNMAGMAFSSYAVLDGSNADEVEFLIGRSDLILLAGGHVPTQNAFFREIGLRELLADFPGVVMGISAGSMNMADVVYAQPEEPGESVPEFPRFIPGLGLTDVNILPHYQKVKDNILDGKRLFEDVTYADSWGQFFFALPDGSYIYQDEEECRVMGPALLIRNGVPQLLTREGESLDLSQITQ